ncbi:MAG: ABC transporter permease [Candidatus Hydrothermales bacterium]
MIKKFKESFSINLRTLIARAYVRIVATHREGSWIFLNGLTGIISLASYVYLYRNLGAKKIYEGFVIIGSFILAFWINVLWSIASQLYWEKLSGNLRYFIIAPCSKMAILIGMSFGGIYMILLRSSFVLFLAFFVFKTPLKYFNPLLIFLTFFITLFGLYGLGMAFSSLYLLWGREAWHLSSLFQEPIYAFSGLYYPIRVLPIFIVIIFSLIPLTLGLDAMRQCFYGKEAEGLLNVYLELIILTFLSIIFIFLSYLSLKKMEEVARKKGTLIERWQ